VAILTGKNLEKLSAMVGHFSESALTVWDFTRCLRPNGTHYGTSGKCRKGSETGDSGKEYSSGITWGKFNIPTPGHAKVVKQLLEKADKAVVVLSPAEKNVDPALRTLMFRALLRREGVDLNRVEIVSGSSRKVLEDLIKKEGAGKVVLGLGEDRRPALEGTTKKLGIGSLLIKRPENSESSTMMRGIIDRGDDETLKNLYGGNLYLARLAKEARRNEVNR
jgi:cytidyltransferase-like protein